MKEPKVCENCKHADWITSAGELEGIKCKLTGEIKVICETCNKWEKLK